MRKLVVINTLLLAAVANSQVVFYGGDMDERDRVLSSTQPGGDGMIFEDFVLPNASTITALFGNWVHDDAVFTSAQFEIRTGMTPEMEAALLPPGLALSRPLRRTDSRSI